MYYNSVTLILYVLGYFGDCTADVDVNRIHQISAKDSKGRLHNTQIRRSLKDNQIIGTHDYDDYSSGYSKFRPPHSILTSQKTTGAQEKNPLKIYQPREDPKLFYQSESYLEEINGQNFNHEVASIYPGKEVIRANERHPIPKKLLRSRGQNHFPVSKICVKCPQDRTLIAKEGVDRVVLQVPKLTTCSGRRVPSNVRFMRMYGSKFGTLIQQGSHVIVGRIMHKNKTLQLCKMQVHVIIQSCATPNYLISHCDDSTKTCNFTCRVKNLELEGENKLTCGEDLKWQGKLPTCRARNWCYPPSPAEHGRISCKSATTGQGLGLAEGSRCRVRCSLGWRWDRSVAVCRRGSWTNTLKCVSKKNTIK